MIINGCAFCGYTGKHKGFDCPSPTCIRQRRKSNKLNSKLLIGQQILDTGRERTMG
jgi:hypothetical protein